MVKAYKEEEKRDGKQEEPHAPDNDDLANKGALDVDPVVITNIIGDNDDDVVLKSGPVDSHMQELLERNLELGTLHALKKIEENIGNFLSKKASYSRLVVEINEFGETLAEDQELPKFTEFMELQRSLNRYIGNLEQLHQSPLARAMAIALGIPINALPGEMLAAIFYVINTTFCKIFADTNSTRESPDFNREALTSSQRVCAINLCFFVYTCVVGIIFTWNINLLLTRNAAQFFPQEYRNNITFILRVLFLMLPLMDAAKTHSLENRIASNFLPTRSVDAGDKKTFNEFLQQISTYMEVPLLRAEENISLPQLLDAVRELQLSHSRAVSDESSIYYQLSQRIKNFQQDRETLEQNIVGLNEKFKKDIQSIQNDYMSLVGFNATIVVDWRKYMHLDADSSIEVSEQDVIRFITKMHEKYDEVNDLVIEFKTKQEEYQQKLSQLRIEFNEIKGELTKLKKHRPEIEVEINDEHSVLLTDGQSSIMGYGTPSIAVSARRSGGSPIYNDGPDEYIIVDGNGSPARPPSPHSP